jgi:uncharacterized protein
MYCNNLGTAGGSGWRGRRYRADPMNEAATTSSPAPAGADSPALASADSPAGPPTPRTKVRRMAERGRYDTATVESILDEGFVCHLGLLDEKSVRVIPTAYARVGDLLYLHGAAGNAALKAGKGADVCVTVTLVDGLVLARAAFHHSINYRSVTIYGTATEVTDKNEKAMALDAVVEHIVPGRTADARRPNDTEMKSTRVLRLPISEASAKVRTGGPKDDAEDMALPIWAGQVPLHTVAETPISDDGLPAGVGVPLYASHYARPTK